MADTVTTKHGFVKPEINASDDTWGNKLNADLDSIDSLLDVRATTTEVLTGTAANRTVTPDALAGLWEKGVDVAAAANLVLGDGGYFSITGSASITDIDFATPKDGRMAWLKFAAAGSVLVHSATLVLPGAQNITVAAGDRALFVQDAGDTVFCLDYMGVGAASIAGLGVGFMVKTAAGSSSYAARSLAAGAGITITNPAGTAGDPSIAVDQAANLTWTGVHSFGNGTAGIAVYVNGAAGQDRYVAWRTAGVNRWGLRASAAAESGGNAGSALVLDAYSDAGAYISSPINVARATGLVSFANGIDVSGGTLRYAGTDIFARANTWTNVNTWTVAIAGTQQFAIRNTVGDLINYVDAPVGQFASFDLRKGNALRWRMQADSSAESGSNAGSNLLFQRYTDAGGFIGGVITINRASGMIGFTVGIDTPLINVSGVALKPSHLAGWPSTTVDNTIPRFDLTTGNIQTSKAMIDDTIALATDTAITLPFISGGNAELALFNCNQRGTATFSGVIRYRPGDPSIDVISMIGGALPANTVVDASTTPLTGTTGAAGSFTIRCGVSGVALSIENRSGATRNIGIIRVGSV